MFHVVLYKATRKPKVLTNGADLIKDQAVDLAKITYQAYKDMAAMDVASVAVAVLVVDDHQLADVLAGNLSSTHQYGPI